MLYVICYLPLLRKMFSKYLVSGAVFNSKDRQSFPHGTYIQFNEEYRLQVNIITHWISATEEMGVMM